jgi:hypothetical protein
MDGVDVISLGPSDSWLTQTKGSLVAREPRGFRGTLLNAFCSSGRQCCGLSTNGGRPALWTPQGGQKSARDDGEFSSGSRPMGVRFESPSERIASTMIQVVRQRKVGDEYDTGRQEICADTQI